VPDVHLDEALWQELMLSARNRPRIARNLLEKAVREFLERAADEELLARTAREARRAKFKIEDTEEIIRRHRARQRSH
jgi:hypothetical protein